MSDKIELPNFGVILESLAQRKDLSSEIAQHALAQVLEGKISDEDLESFLLLLNSKGATDNEVAGFVKSMRASCLRIHCPEGTIDLVGAGGSEMGRKAALNVSTIASFVAAGAGANVCKHGNRRASSTSGSFDLLEELGIDTESDAEQIEQCVNKLGIGFAFARIFHPAMKYAGPIRAKLGIPTIFNTLGPLSHPGFLTRQVVGVPSHETAKQMASVLQNTGTQLGMVVTGHNGLDELSTTGTNIIHVITPSSIEIREVSPTDVGIDIAAPDQIYGGSPKENAKIAIQILSGEEGPKSDIIVLNAAAGLVVSGIAENFIDGVERARASIESGAAQTKLHELQNFTDAPKHK